MWSLLAMPEEPHPQLSLLPTSEGARCVISYRVEATANYSTRFAMGPYWYEEPYMHYSLGVTSSEHAGRQIKQRWNGVVVPMLVPITLLSLVSPLFPTDLIGDQPHFL